MSTVEQAVEDLLSEQDWTGKIFSDGWVDAPETIETVEPATGEVLGTAGLANAASVAAAAKSAARAQPAWAAVPADVDGPPRADRRGRRDHTLELPDRAGDAIARPCARAGERGGAQERP